MPEQNTQPGAVNPPMMLRGDHVGLITVPDPAGNPVPILQIIGAGGLFAAQVAVSDEGIDQVITALEDIRRRRRGLVITSELPNGGIPRG